MGKKGRGKREDRKSKRCGLVVLRSSSSSRACLVSLSVPVLGLLCTYLYPMRNAGSGWDGDGWRIAEGTWLACTVPTLDVYTSAGRTNVNFRHALPG